MRALALLLLRAWMHTAQMVRKRLTVEDAGALACALPGVVEATSYGTRSWKVGRKFLMREKERMDNVLVVVTDSVDEQEFLIERDPDAYFITDHYRGYSAVLVRLAKITRPVLAAHIERVWRARATKKQIAAYDQE